VIALAEIEAARERIAGKVRETPMMRASPLRVPLPGNPDLWLKLESLQIAGSFKARGATSKVATLEAPALAAGLVTASGGNHGLGVAYAGWQAGAPARVYLPESSPDAKAVALADWGATAVRHGAVWDDANQAAVEAAESEGLTYIHPFADPAVIAGQGTIGLEITEALPDVETVIVAIGGGGLISGVASAVKARCPSARIIGVEPVGAPTLLKSVRAGRLITLDAIETAVGVLAPRRSAEINLEIITSLVDDIVLVTDDEMLAGARWLWRELGVAAELGGAAAIAALQTGKVGVEKGERVCALVCGAGDDGVIDSRVEGG
jgi:threonine dehydratase